MIGIIDIYAMRDEEVRAEQHVEVAFGSAKAKPRVLDLLAISDREALHRPDPRTYEPASEAPDRAAIHDAGAVGL